MRFAYPSSTLSDNVPISESQLKQIRKVFSQYQGFELVFNGDNQGYKQGYKFVSKTYAQVLISADAVYWKNLRKN